MEQITDQNGIGARGGADFPDRALVGRVLAAMADHFTVCRPKDILTSDAVPVCVSAEVYNATSRKSGGNSALLAAVTAALPEAKPRVTRRQYADTLRAQAAAYGWSGDERGGRADR